MSDILTRVHPDFESLLSGLADAPPLTSLSPTEARAVYREMQPTAPNVAVGAVEHIEIPGPAGSLKARHYKPEGPGPHPVIVHFHGGGFVIGDLETHDAQCRYLCRHAQAIVTAIDYRLAPEHPFPAAHEDCFSALRWTADNAASFGGDAARLAVAGDSAGGNLAAACALRARQEGGPALKAQLLIVPALDRGVGNEARQRAWAARDNPILSLEIMAWFMGHYVPDAAQRADPRLAPLAEADLSGLAPALIVPAEIDVLHDEAIDYAKAIQAAGGAAELMVGEGMIHPFFSMPHMVPAAEAIVIKAATRLGDMLRA